MYVFIAFLLFLLPIISTVNVTMPTYSSVTSRSNDRELTILTTITFNSVDYPHVGPFALDASRLALEHLSQLGQNWLPGYRLRLELIDDECSNAPSTVALVEKVRNSHKQTSMFPLVLLSECNSNAQVIPATFFKEFNFIGHSINKNNAQLNQLSNYFGSVERTDHFTGLLALFKQMNWNRVALVSEINPYYDQMDFHILQLFAENNISVVSYAKLNYQTKDEEEMAKEFTMMKRRDPRIILSHSLSATSIACWLHRTGFVGPQYVFLTLNWLALDPNFIEIPDHWNGWCTKDMVLDILQSTISFGDGTDVDEASVDTQRANYWFSVYYDRILSLGHVLNETQHLLAMERNESLQDWFSNTDNFQNNGNELMDIVKKAILNMDFIGLKGVYGYKNDNLKGTFEAKVHFPTAFFQMIFHNRTVENLTNFNTVKSAVFKNGTLIETRNGFNWLTYNGEGPKGSMNIEIVQLPLCPFGFNVFLKSIASLLALAIAMSWMFIVAYRKMGENSTSIFFIAFGNVMIISHIFLIPLTSIEYNENIINSLCVGTAFLIAIGLTIVLSAISASLSSSDVVKKLLGLWIFINMIIFTIISTTVGLSESNLTQLEMKIVPNTDQSEAQLPMRWECVAFANAVAKQKEIYILISISAIGNFLLIFKICLQIYLNLLAFKVAQSKAKAKSTFMMKQAYKFSSFVQPHLSSTQFDQEGETSIGVQKLLLLKNTANCIYCEIIILIATCLIASLRLNDLQFLFFTISITSLCFVIVNTFFILFCPLKTNNQSIDSSAA